jgi:hypothetical protein
MWFGGNPMSNQDDWEQAIVRRFDGRENLAINELYNRFFKNAELRKDEVVECLKLLESEYKVPAGVLRPNDKLAKLFHPVRATTPWQWLVYRTREGDTETEINYELGKRMRRSGTVKSWSHIKRFGDLTVSDLLRAWCGLTPTLEEK